MSVHQRRFAVLHTGGAYYTQMAEALARGFREHRVGAAPVSIPNPRVIETVEPARRAEARRFLAALPAALAAQRITDVFVVNIARQDLAIPEGVTHHCWVQDPYVAPVERGPVGDRTWMWVGAWAEWWGGRVLLPATDFGMYAAEVVPIEADVAFAGYFPSSEVEVTEELIGRFPAHLRAPIMKALRVCARVIVAEIEGSQSFHCGRDYAESILARADDRLGQRIEQPMRAILIESTRANFVRHVQRKRLVEFLVPLCERRGWRLKLAGRRWDTNPLTAPHHAGDIPAGPTLAQFYKSAKVNLQLNGDTNVHTRLLEGLACGAFMLSEAHPTDDRPHGLRSILEASMAPTFRDFAELEAMLERYIGDDAARAEAARSGGAIVRAHHDYRSRAREVLEAR